MEWRSARPAISCASIVACLSRCCWTAQRPARAVGRANDERAGNAALARAGCGAGDVHVLQGDTEMHCKVLVVFYEEETGGRTVKAADPGPGGDRQISRIEAKGNVVVVQKDQNATGDRATFNMRENTVTLIGNVVVTRGTDVLRGQRLTVDLTSGVSKMDGGRVDGIFQAGPRGPPDPRNPAEKSSS